MGNCWGRLFSGQGQGYPTPRNFFDQKCYFPHISPIFEIMGLKKIWGGRYPLLRASFPLKFFCVVNYGWLDAFTHTLPQLVFVVFGQILAFLALSPGSTPQTSPQVPKSVIVNRQCGYEKLLGVVILWVGVGGTPPPEIFLTKNVIFHIFHQYSRSWE